jgi:exosortase A
MSALASVSAPGDGWRVAVPVTALLALCLIFRHTLWSMATVWGQSETFAHGALIIPICIVLVWRQRDALASTLSVPCYPALLGMLLLGVLWLAADVANVPVLAQYAVLAMLPCTLLAVLGTGTVRHIAFPLCFAFLAVPSGEFLIGPLIDFTTAFTVGALQAVGVPVYRDGNMLTLPTGEWAVVDACSGLRYMIACFALGVLYAHFMYRSWRKRLAFVAASLVLPIVANGMRAFLIVMLGHWSDMKLATGVDHIIYGSLFFVLLLGLLFWLGSFWRDDAAASPAKSSPVRLQVAEHAAPLSIAVACVGIAALWPITSASLASRPVPPLQLDIVVPPGFQAKAATQLVQYNGSDAAMSMAYQQGTDRVQLQLALYRHHGEGLRRASSQCADYGAQWRRIAYQERLVTLPSGTVKVQQSILSNQQGRLLAWCWFRQSGIETASASVAKALLAGHALAGMREDGARILLATKLDEQTPHAAGVLERFLVELHQPILHGVDHASAR